jgi:hypothetical protein
VSGGLTLDVHGHVVEREGKTREYKRDLFSPARPLRTIAAFANSAGGQLVIGDTDDVAVVGVADPLAEEERIANLITDSISPQLVPAIGLVTFEMETVLVIDVPMRTRRPHFITFLGIDGGVYVRLGSTTRLADPALVAELERTARGVAFEDQPEAPTTLDDTHSGRLPRQPDRGGQPRPCRVGHQGRDHAARVTAAQPVRGADLPGGPSDEAVKHRLLEEAVDRVQFTVFVTVHGTAATNSCHDYDRGDGGRQVGRHDVVMLSASAGGPVHQNDLLAAAGLKPLAQNYARHVAPLVGGCLLEMTVPDKPRSKAQRYRLSEVGRTFLADVSGRS